MPNGDQDSQELISALNYLGHPVDVTLQSPQVLAGGGPGAIPFPTTAEGGGGTTGTALRTRGGGGGGFPFQLAEDVLKLGKKASSLIPQGQGPTRVTSPVAGVGPEPAQIPGMPPPTGETLFGGPAPTVTLSPEFADPLAAPGGIPSNLLQDIFGPTPQVTSGLESSLMANPALLEHAASLAPGAGVPAALEAETSLAAPAAESFAPALSALSALFLPVELGQILKMISGKPKRSGQSPFEAASLASQYPGLFTYAPTSLFGEQISLGEQPSFYSGPTFPRRQFSSVAEANAFLASPEAQGKPEWWQNPFAEGMRPSEAFGPGGGD